MTTEIAPREATDLAPLPTQPSRLVETAMHMGQVWQLADRISKTAFCPEPFRNKPGDLAAAMMYGDELGLPPMASTRAVYVVNGTPGLYAKYMVAVTQAAGHEVWTEEDTPAKVTVCGRRRGLSHVEKVTWTTERARKAGYTRNKKYETDPQAMLYARAAGDVCRRIAMDAIGGLALTVEELQLDSPPETVTVSRGDTKRTVRRSAPVETPEPDLEPAPQTDDGEPASPVADAATDEEALASGGETSPSSTPMISSQQTKLLGVLMKEAELTDRSAALAYAANVIGRQIGSRTELTRAEASRVIKQLDADAKNIAAAEPTNEQWDEPTEATS